MNAKERRREETDAPRRKDAAVAPAFMYEAAVRQQSLTTTHDIPNRWLLRLGLVLKLQFSLTPGTGVGGILRYFLLRCVHTVLRALLVWSPKNHHPVECLSALISFSGYPALGGVHVVLG